MNIVCKVPPFAIFGLGRHSSILLSTLQRSVVSMYLRSVRLASREPKDSLIRNCFIREKSFTKSFKNTKNSCIDLRWLKRCSQARTMIQNIQASDKDIVITSQQIVIPH